MRIFRISHLRRGGGHAVALWIFRHFDSAIFSNNVYNDIKANITRGAGDDIVLTYEDKPERPAECYILRDVYNYAASRMAMSDKLKPNSPSVHRWLPNSLGLWIQFAQLPVIFTYFPRFATHKSYRLAEAHRLELPNELEDPDMSKDAGFGGGSSFNGTKGFAPGRDLNARYERYLNDARMREVIDNVDARRLNAQHFGWYINTDGSRNKC